MRVLVPLLALLMLSLCIYSYFELEHHSPFPGVGKIESDYRFYVGKRVLILGTVKSSGEDACIISTDSHDFAIAPIPAKFGDKVEVLGVLEENHRIATEKVLVYERLNYYSIFLRSSMGVVLLVWFFFRNWRFEIRRFKFMGGD